tara:strand:+ start:674 stop:1261 length:588 start_codon:yes stop_codon:yes gene_type:complete
MGNLTNAKAITFVDVETTHLDPSRSAILQISIITDWEDGRQEQWTTKIKPRDMEVEYADPEALKICGYSFEEWSDAPLFEEVAETIAKKLRWGPIVAHNAQFDVAHLTASFKRRGWREPKRNERFDEVEKLFRVGYPIIDTCALAYMYLPTNRQNLNELRDHFGISKENAHTADADVQHCREVFYKILDQTLSAK